MSKLLACFPRLTTLKLANIKLDYCHMRGLTTFTRLQCLQLQNVKCRRETFAGHTERQSDHIFAHLRQLTHVVLELRRDQGCDDMTYFLTADLHGLPYLTNLRSLVVRTELAFPEPATVCDKVVHLPYLTCLHIGRPMSSLTSLTNLKQLRLDKVPREGFPANFSAMQGLTQLYVGVYQMRADLIATLTGLHALVHLTFEGSLHHLKQWDAFEELTQIRQLGLIGVSLDDSMFAALAHMPSLQEITLSIRTGSALNKGSAAHACLSALQHLQDLFLSTCRGCSMTFVPTQLRMKDDMLACFQQSLPFVTVHHVDSIKQFSGM